MNEFIHRFRQIAATYPKQCAISCDNDWQMTYEELESKASKLAQILVSKGIGPGHLVGIHISKSPEYLIALLSIWMAEAAFVPIDPSLPAARHHFYLNQSKPSILIHKDFTLEVLSDGGVYNPNLAYIFFTSGSTGQAKGVLISHEGIVNFLEQQIQEFAINATSRALFYLSTQFDASISDIGTAFLSGATLCLTKNDAFDAALNLPIILEKNKITHIDMPPSLLSALDVHCIPATLKTVIIGGETCPAEKVRQWAKHFRLINSYGPTETTVCSSMIHCTEHFEYASIGKPINNINYCIFDEQGQSASVGELYISGIGLALGYLNNQELTQAKFVTIEGVRHYRTGDLVKKDKLGNYYYLGRIDRQVKIRGQLIEPEEIEAALYQHPAVTSAAVVVKESEHRKQLLALVEAQQVTTNMLTYFLTSLLPTWMIPNHLIIVDKIPKGTNGKIDYNSIKKTHFTNQEPNHYAEDDTITNQLQHICQEVLELPFLPFIHDNLFTTLGASSLDIINIIVRAELKGLYCSTEIIKHLPTIHDLSTWLHNNTIVSSDSMSTELLKKESIDARTYVSVPKSTSNEVFLTGSTGFLGIHLLKELLLNSNQTITCLVRAHNQKEALKKIQDTAVYYDLNINQYKGRINIVLGDIALPQLGLTDSDWNDMCKQIGHIYHCAAELNMIKSFAELKQINLEGTKEIARLALTKSKKNLAYISTLSVFVASDRNTGVCKENDRLEKTQLVYGGYAQSKWAAEYFLQHSELDVTIFRLGLLTGHSSSGKSASHDYLTLFVNGLKEIGSIPEGPCDSIYLDATPVDFAAQAIVYLSNKQIVKCYNIANRTRFSLKMVVNAMKKLGIDLRISKANQWLVNTKPNAAMAAAYMALCRLLPEQQHQFERFRSMDLFQATDIDFDQEDTLKELAQAGIFCPEADELLMEKYIGRILNVS